MSENDSVGSALLAELESMRGELTTLRAKVADLEAARAPQPIERVDDSEGEPGVSSRRRLLVRAGGVAAAVVAGSAIASGRPVAANNGDAIAVANNAVSDSASVISTFVNYSIPSTNPNSRHLFVVGDAGDAFSPGADRTAAVGGYASRVVKIGVYGHSTSGTGVLAESSQAWSLHVGGTGRAYFAQASAAGPPTTGTFSAGELIRDGNADFWVCTVGGANANAQWKKLAFAGPQLHIIDPVRVYDSRLPGAGSTLAAGASRTILVANGINIETGGVATPDVVPSGASAVQFTLTVAGATSNGFLALTPGGSGSYKASTINWTSGTPILATGGLCKLDASRQLKVYAGGGGGTDFIVDITGYYL